MWKCPKCKRTFNKNNQPHSCATVPLSKHFGGKDKAKDIFSFLVEEINKEIGTCKTISITCCIHLFGKYDFLAALPKRDRLEIRFALDRKLDSKKLKECVPLSAKIFKNCIDIYSLKDIDKALIGFLKESYYLK